MLRSSQLVGFQGRGDRVKVVNNIADMSIFRSSAVDRFEHFVGPGYQVPREVNEGQDAGCKADRRYRVHRARISPATCRTRLIIQLAILLAIARADYPT